MKPSKSILDRSFDYISSAGTAVDATWRKYGWKPPGEQGRNGRASVRAVTAVPRKADPKVGRNA